MKNRKMIMSVLICLVLGTLLIGLNLFFYPKSESAIFFGDSVAYGHSTNGKGFGFYLDLQMHFKTYRNAAVNTATFNTQTQGENNIIEQIKKHQKEQYDYVILEGGFGDLRDVVSLGHLEEKGKQNYDTSTFAGSVDYALDLITTTWNHSKIGVVISYDASESHYGIRDDYKKVKKYWDILKEACKKWNVEYIDFFEGNFKKNGTKKSFSEILKVKETVYLEKDMIHPNQKGYQLITKYMSKWMKTLKPYQSEQEKYSYNWKKELNLYI